METEGHFELMSLKLEEYPKHLNTISQGLPFTCPEKWEFKHFFAFLQYLSEEAMKNNDLVDPIFGWLNLTYPDEPWYSSIILANLAPQGNVTMLNTILKSPAWTEYCQKWFK